MPSDGTRHPTWRTYFRSACHLDLYVAIVVMIGTAILLSIGSWSPPWAVFGVVAVPLSAALLGVSVHQRDMLDDLLTTTDYGELVRIVDPSSEKVMAPYFVTHLSALMALSSSTITAVAMSVTTNRAAVVALVPLTMFFVVWAVLAEVSLARLGVVHRRHVSQIQALREELSEQRH